ncbi:hypothetical protein HF285_00130 [Acidithiobacillus ferrooxidans F221]|jgi:hypothetical protein|uniref:hypothetical protein n=1 Tax=Acidithiobacillus ferrooxidans TaxID=920 RepID=UPI001C0691DA|nr:hypothetical protein [Acidithiobacillus ferrooxidans]MBU2806726.1 hypothetical protein [Acidithiobacillus ferrooxidans F221]
MSCCDRTIKDVSTVQKTAEGVAVHVDNSVETKKVFAIVENCQTGQCDCMSAETKAKVTGMEVVQGENGTQIHIAGDLSPEEITAAMARSTKTL